MDELMLRGSDGEALNRIMASIPLQIGPEMEGTSGGGVQKNEAVGVGIMERVLHWSQQETREFIGIRAELERDFTVSKRKKMLWEVVAARMREKGYLRSPEQCKCKWKNLVNRYKGKETSDPDNGRHCPFFDELNAVFTERANNMQHLLLESESGSLHPKKKTKRTNDDKSSDEFSEDDEGGFNDSSYKCSNKSRKKTEKQKQFEGPAADKSSKTTGSILDILQDFFQQQQRMEIQWHEILERRAQERQMFEQEWRQSMEKLERERLMLDQAWREREEQRRIREESRAEKRDALLTTLLNKLINDDL